MFFFPALSMESCSISCSFLRIFDGPTLWIFRQAGGETIFPKHQRCQVGGTVFGDHGFWSLLIPKVVDRSDRSFRDCFFHKLLNVLFFLVKQPQPAIRMWAANLP